MFLASLSVKMNAMVWSVVDVVPMLWFIRVRLILLCRDVCSFGSGVKNVLLVFTAVVRAANRPKYDKLVVQ